MVRTRLLILLAVLVLAPTSCSTPPAQPTAKPAPIAPSNHDDPDVWRPINPCYPMP